MSAANVEQLLPPPIQLTHQPYTTHAGHGSVGPVIAVLAVVTVLGVVAAIIGRLCSGRSIMGYGHFDIETWVQTKCSSCIDGRITPSPPPPPSVGVPQEEVEEEQEQEPRQSSQQ